MKISNAIFLQFALGHQTQGAVQKSSFSKAAYCVARLEERFPCFARGAYWYYVSTEKWRERRLACPILKGGPVVFNSPRQESWKRDDSYEKYAF